MKKQNGFAHLIMIALFVVVGAMGYASYNVYKNISDDQNEYVLENSDDDSDTAIDKYTENKSSLESQKQNPAPTPETQSKVIVGNNDPTKAPVISPQIPLPKTPIESIETFINAVKNKDFVTANNLIGNSLANKIANYTNTSEINKALEACTKDSTCNLFLQSFQPPKTGYTSKNFTPVIGTEGTQISFLLSQSSTLLSNIVGDANIDILTENFQGVWIIQDVYVDGESLDSY